jgi:hypothetical protein
MGYVYGFFLLICIAGAFKGQGRSYWLRSLGPAAAVAGLLAVFLAGSYGTGPLVESLIPSKGSAAYRLARYGFFHGIGREFWAWPRAGVWSYFRYEVGFWLLGSVSLVWGGLAALMRMMRGQSTADEARDDEIVACCAALHVVFVTCFFGHRMSWTYYFTILILGLTVRCKGSRMRVVAAWCLVALLLVSDRSKLLVTYREWSTAAPSPETIGLWATPAERAEWRTVLEVCEGREAVLLAAFDGSLPVVPRFAPPVAAYLCPGITLPVEARRKADQLSSAETIVAVVPREWEGFTYWPQFAAALDGRELMFEGSTFRVYRRIRPGWDRATSGL